MANRRMFSKSITNSGKFLKMPPTSRLLYYDFGMNADDDGYVEWFTILKMTSSTEQDMKVLQANKFIEVFDDNVLVILDWKENNQIRIDRYLPSKYKDIYGLPNGNQKATIGKPSIGKVSIGKERKEENTSETSSQEIPLVIKSFEKINPASKKFYGIPTQRKACADLIETYTLERVISVIEKTLPKTNGIQYFPTITTPLQLYDKWATLESKIKQYQSEKTIKNEKYQII